MMIPMKIRVIEWLGLDKSVFLFMNYVNSEFDFLEMDWRNLL